MRATFKMRQVFYALALTAMVAASAGCASGARTAQMTASASVPATQAGEPGYKQFRVDQVQGGSDTNPMWMSNVSNEDFKAALEASLRATNYLADDPGQATLGVTANMVELDRPLAGLDMSVTTRVRYSAADLKTNAVVFDDTVAATGTGKMGEALLGVERLRLANEKSVQANIEQFIQRLRDRLKAERKQ